MGSRCRPGSTTALGLCGAPKASPRGCPGQRRRVRMPVCSVLVCGLNFQIWRRKVDSSVHKELLKALSQCLVIKRQVTTPDQMTLQSDEKSEFSFPKCLGRWSDGRYTAIPARMRLRAASPVLRGGGRGAWSCCLLAAPRPQPSWALKACEACQRPLDGLPAAVRAQHGRNPPSVSSSRWQLPCAPCAFLLLCDGRCFYSLMCFSPSQSGLCDLVPSSSRASLPGKTLGRKKEERQRGRKEIRKEKG